MVQEPNQNIKLRMASILSIENTKLIQLYRVLFHEKDYSFSKYKAFVGYFGNENMQGLVKFLGGFYPEFRTTQRKNLGATEAYKALFGKTTATIPTINAKLNNLLSELYQLTEQFIIIQSAQENPLLPPYEALLRVYSHHTLRDSFMDYHRKISSLAKENTSQNAFRESYELYTMTREANSFLGITDRQKMAQDLAQMSDPLHKMLFTNILYYSSVVLSAQLEYRYEYDDPLLSTTLAYIDTHQDWAKESPILWIHYRVCKSFALPEQTDIEQISRLLSEYAHLFNSEDYRTLYNILGNIAASLINTTGKIEAYNILYTLYQKQITEGIFLSPDNRIHLSTFRNYIVAALYLDKVSEAVSFIQTYRSYIPDSPANVDFMGYCDSLILFENKKYKEVISRLRTVQFKDEGFSYRAQLLFLKAWFELDNIAHHKAGRFVEFNFQEQLFQFEQRVLKSKILSAANIVSYQSFIDAMLLIIQQANQYRKDCMPAFLKQQIIADFESVSVLREKTWILEKCNDL
jgi:hypothetical protein